MAYGYGKTGELSLERTDQAGPDRTDARAIPRPDRRYRPLRRSRPAGTRQQHSFRDVFRDGAGHAAARPELSAQPAGRYVGARATRHPVFAGDALARDG